MSPPGGSTDTDTTRYPDVGLTPFRYYGRAVWPMGEDGDDGVMVQGNDRRAWAALNAYARAETPGDRPGHGQYGGTVESKLVTFRTTCGCTAEQHADHAAEVHAILAEGRARREAGMPIHEAWLPWRSCEEITGNADCMSLPPCEDERMAWLSTDHDPDAGPVPENAAPVLRWA